jgi:hypothetical protein
VPTVRETTAELPVRPLSSAAPEWRVAIASRSIMYLADRRSRSISLTLRVAQRHVASKKLIKDVRLDLTCVEEKVGDVLSQKILWVNSDHLLGSGRRLNQE